MDFAGADLDATVLAVAAEDFAVVDFEAEEPGAVDLAAVDFGALDLVDLVPVDFAPEAVDCFAVVWAVANRPGATTAKAANRATGMKTAVARKDPV